jgi:phage I-like protein
MQPLDHAHPPPASGGGPAPDVQRLVPHVAFRATDGVDPDWSIWYADHLLAQGLEKLLDAKLLKSDVIYLLVLADKEQQREAPGGHWERYYADFLLRRYRK